MAPARPSIRATLRVAALSATLVGGALIGIASGASSVGKTAVVTDHSGDVADGGIDLTRIAFGRAPGGQLRASVSTEDDFAPSDLRSRTGNPGSICLKLWTTESSTDTPPNFLVCATANAEADAIRGSLLGERPDQLPAYLGPVSVTRSSEHNLTLRFSQSSIGKPAVIVFAGESTKPGCPRVSCIDTAPDAPKTATLTLRAVTSKTATQ